MQKNLTEEEYQNLISKYPHLIEEREEKVRSTNIIDLPKQEYEDEEDGEPDDAAPAANIIPMVQPVLLRPEQNSELDVPAVAALAAKIIACERAIKYHGIQATLKMYECGKLLTELKLFVGKKRFVRWSNSNENPLGIGIETMRRRMLFFKFIEQHKRQDLLQLEPTEAMVKAGIRKPEATAPIIKVKPVKTAATVADGPQDQPEQQDGGETQDAGVRQPEPPPKKPAVRKPAAAVTPAEPESAPISDEDFETSRTLHRELKSVEPVQILAETHNAGLPVMRVRLPLKETIDGVHFGDVQCAMNKNLAENIAVAIRQNPNGLIIICEKNPWLESPPAPFCYEI